MNPTLAASLGVGMFVVGVAVFVLATLVLLIGSLVTIRPARVVARLRNVTDGWLWATQARPVVEESIERPAHSSRRAA